MKRVFSVVIALLLLIAPATPAFAARDTAFETKLAETLKALNLFEGVSDTEFELGRAPTRVEALVMLLRALGKGAEAKNSAWAHPFTDVPPWADGYVGYAYTNKLTNGVSDSEFGTGDASAAMYLTFMLRALGYSDAGDRDFNWADPFTLARQAGILPDRVDTADFWRADVVSVTYAALSAKLKDSAQTLAQKLIAAGVFTQERFDALYRADVFDGDPTPDVPQPAASDETVTHQVVTIDGVTAHVLTVNLKNPRVRLRAGMVDGTVAARESFSETVTRSGGALAVITANFMNGDSEGNYPVGHFMSDGELKYIGSGYTAVGITADGEVRFGRPEIRVRMKPTQRQYDLYNAIGLNLSAQQQEWTLSTLYTPAFGARFETAVSGNITVVRGGSVQQYRTVAPGEQIDIPADGYVLLLSDEYMRYVPGVFAEPRTGEQMQLEYYLDYADAEGFTLDGVTQIIAGAPRLVRNGAICTEQEPQFSGDRFAADFASSRTAVGVDAEGRLIFATVTSATIPQLRSLMLSLGCVNAVNLDGGASTALYYDGVTYVRPGRQLATTVRIYVD